MYLMFQPLQKYFVFSGRAGRQEFWLFVLFLWIISLILQLVAYTIGHDIAFWISVVFEVLIIIPYLAVSIRRLHDTDRSGWWILLSLIPLFGTIWLVVLMVLPGTKDSNRFGPIPIPSNPE